MKVSAGIVTFNPETSRLKKSIVAILPQVDQLIIVDNYSKNFHEIETTCKQVASEKIKLIKNSDNLGLSKAYNQIFDAIRQKSDWLLILDDDTVCPENLIDEYKHVINHCSDKIGIISPVLFDSRINQQLWKVKSQNLYSKIDRCISSASLNNVKALDKIGGFDDRLFIDYVDFDECEKMKKAGYLIIRANRISIDHQLGDAKMYKFLFASVRVTNHSAFRKYYIARNMTFFIRKYHNQIDVKKEKLRFFKVVLFTILFEDDKRNKLKNIHKGYRDGKKMDINR